MTNAHPTYRSHAASDDGAVTVIAIAIALLVAGLLVFVFAEGMNSNEANRTNSSRLSDGSSAEAFGEQIQFALESGLASRSQNYALDSAALGELASGAGGIVVPNDETAFPQTQMPNDYTFSVHSRKGGDGLATYWQVVKIIPEDIAGGRPYLSYFVRSWRQAIPNDPSGPEVERARKTSSDSRMVRFDIRPGRFSDYQILSDGPIKLENGTTVTGRVHSNGFSNDLLRPAAGEDVPTDSRIWSEGSFDCSSDVTLSTASGAISIPEDADCKTHKSTGRQISVSRGKQALETIESLCPVDPHQAPLATPDHVWCDPNPVIGSDARYWIQLKNNKIVIANTKPSASDVVTFAGPEAGFEIPTTPDDEVTFLFRRNVILWGEASTRVTIAVVQSDDPGSPAPKITVGKLTNNFLGDPLTGQVTGIRANDIGEDKRSSIGLISEGDIELLARQFDDHGDLNPIAGNPDAADNDGDGVRDYTCQNWQPVTTMQGVAAVAVTGGLTINRNYISPTKPRGTLPHCDGHTDYNDDGTADGPASLNISGSIASHLPTTLYWKWGSSWAGYRPRAYSYDSSLKDYPPPFMPLDNRWEIVNAEAVSADCLQGDTEVGANCL